jgi:hypothetical protein
MLLRAISGLDQGESHEGAARPPRGWASSSQLGVQAGFGLLAKASHVGLAAH